MRILENKHGKLIDNTKNKNKTNHVNQQVRSTIKKSYNKGMDYYQQLKGIVWTICFKKQPGVSNTER